MAPELARWKSHNDPDSYILGDLRTLMGWDERFHDILAVVAEIADTMGQKFPFRKKNNIGGSNERKDRLKS